MTKTRFKSLTFKQTILVVFTALFFAIAIFMLEVFMVVKAGTAELKQDQQELLDSVEQPLENALWGINVELGTQTLEGVLKVDHVASAEVLQDDNVLFVKAGEARSNKGDFLEVIGNQLFAPYEQVTRPLMSPSGFDNRSPELIGTLYINYDPRELAESLFDQLKLSFFATLARALFITLVLSYIFHRFLTQPIAKIGEAIDQIDPEQPDNVLLPTFASHNDDELGLVTSKLNQILVQFSQTQNKLRKMATRDSLTGLPNRTLLLETIALAIQRAKHNQQQMALFFIDLDRFKNINDSLGHALGDQFLIKVAGLLRRIVGNKGTVARLGGDEFVIMQEHIRSANEAAEFVGQLLKQLQSPIKLEEHAVHPAASVGISIFPDDGCTADDLIRHADMAMYSAKAAGSNQWAFFKQQMTEKAAVMLRTEASLHDAILNNEFLLHFQPKLDIRTGELLGCEALIRWQRDGRLISPMTFIPVAEETGIIIPIGRWVLEQSCKVLNRWQKQYQTSTIIACNVSSKQFNSASLVPDIKRLAMRYQIDPGLLEIEITETSLMNDIEPAIDKLHQLKSAGFGIAVDDFGTGYSSLSYLRHLPITTLKIDRAFISDLPEDSAIASTILMLGQQLGLNIVAEGIENEAQESWLKAHGCIIGQGFYYSKPLPVEEFEQRYLVPAAQRVSSE
ncbi:EAL domain-containing protein [Shewanella sp. C32]|uniref:EAL domain-containing protein n=1 Tax=Shewanella electrica TaxID=515560 RepID=A0ABT2FF97_9GAMM|nr:EAL domain-containing protein [Shewanella electrica]MCH1925065.1 EAL domain-containing protein [Shewanella electrica]MCS4554889.1 EAL domain-containing protein [Shewanella electrica]